MKPRMLQLFVFVLLVGTWGLGEAVEPLKPYDTFEVGPISPDRWNGTSFGTGAPFQSSHLYEGNRTIIMDPSDTGRALRILNRSYGRTDSNDGFIYGAYGLAFKNSDTVTAIKAKLKVLSVVSKGCLPTARTTSAQADILGFFFNTGDTPPTDPQDNTNDVLAIVGVGRDSITADPANVLNVFTFVAKCLDHDCIQTNTIGGVPLGKVKVGEWVSLLMQWDRDNSRFIFQRGLQAPQFVSYLNVVLETGPAHVQVKRIDVANFVPNCMDPARPVAAENVLWDDVAVNRSAIP